MDQPNKEEKLRALEIEIKRTKNKIKFFESQLFPKPRDTKETE
jgi:hypothetical protein